MQISRIILDTLTGRQESSTSHFKHYNQALALNPRHRGAHEYIGEAYLIKGDLKNAQKHLAALREICSLPCEELTDLDREIANYVKQSAVNRSR